MAREARATDAEALGYLGLARRAGRAVVGRRALEDAARAGRLAALVVARDATENGRRRLAGVVRRADVPAVELADRVRLGAAVGKGPVVAVGVTDPALASRLLREAEGAPDARGFRGGASPGRDRTGSRMQNAFSPREDRR